MKRMKLVPYRVSQQLLFNIVARPLEQGSGDILFEKTLRNLNKMISDGRPCKVISPTRLLDKSEIEQYRRYFCKKAKEDKVNYVYFTIPVKIFKKEDSNDN